MPVLTSLQRNTLETAVKKARKLAEEGAKNALQALAVDQTESFAHLNPDQKLLRNRLRSKARLMGDELPATGEQQLHHLIYELAYEYWHKMLFAKFLEANDLLMHPDGVAVTLEECEELANEEGFTDKWDAAATYASKMLPAIFRPEDPLIQISYASNDRINLETILDNLDNDIFTADDALGWVYQFWQSEAKAIINASGDKINGETLPAVTQLFTEPYMVHFLIDNTLGAWWVSRNPGIKPPVSFDYLRFSDDGTPAAGNFEGWPDKTAAVTSLDPCMGSGHFIGALFSVFAPLRMYEEGLSKEQATDKVIAENLHGLELDARCTQIAAFNLALTAWKFCGQYKELPEMNLACSGIAPKGKKEDWVKLVDKESDANQKTRLKNGMEFLYDHFQLAPELGSLLDPSTIKADMYIAGFEELKPILIKALEGEADKDQIERGVMAAGIAKAGQLLSKKYILQITNVPYLSRGKQDKAMADYCGKNYPEAKGDLATVFLEKMLKSNTKGGISCSVIPQNWLFLTSYKKFREKFLKNESWGIVARLGAKSFQTPMWDFNVMLISIQHQKPTQTQKLIGFDVSEAPNATAKDDTLKTVNFQSVNQLEQLKNPDARVVIGQDNETVRLSEYAISPNGMHGGDSPRFRFFLWELSSITHDWRKLQNTVKGSILYGGRDSIFYWPEKGKIHNENKNARIQGDIAWGKKGVTISLIGNLSPTLYKGDFFDISCSPIVPKNQEHLPAIWCFCSSPQFNEEVRKIDQKLNVTNATLVKVPFDLEYWQKVADEQYPHGLPKPYSNDVTQWLFHGHPEQSDNPLQVAVARMIGYRWPAESDTEMELSEEARYLIETIKAFDHLTDEDGILCIPPVNGELSASERLRSYLQAVYGEFWANNTISQLLAKEGSTKTNLEEWFREEFFEQHNRLFQNRPFIWHIWDGRKDGFAALVNYHKLNKENLQRLIFTYLGDWIRQCEAKKKAGESGAEGLLSAATKLKEKLEAILEGEAPYDVFVRWKPLAQQPIGWEPDLNDGVRLNIRPFITADILRKKPNIKWGIDRGKNPPGAPWGEVRDNDVHLSLEEKQRSRNE
ncbi:Eco57I restriction-modification methylase domain-containing protein [Runella sp. SP2]|uniref:Eco57I restriction-modification methylase domain-containing protein n=1 Tax=Runella sp. SP2 TaxID=2268026 RepID=UPI000F091562|nr:type II restriction endonuclease subunit M [Runella sp. SP2]AYQ36586.1 type II restriction endonuclease subunit M [Runella sp. SP2]